MKKKKIKVAVIGTGQLAQSQHIPNISRSATIELAILCDLRKNILNELGNIYTEAALETDYKKVLANPEIDIVVIATKEDSHVSLTLEALDAGKHVYVEKPLAENEADCQKVIDKQKTTNKLVAVGMNRRLAPAYRYAHDLLWANGGPKNMFYRIADSYCLDWGKSYPPRQRIVHEVCHIFDILRFFAQSEVKSVYCVESRADDEQITLQFKSGTVASILSSGYVTSDMPKERLEAIADRGSVTVDDFIEVKRFTFETGEDVKTFAGHIHPLHERLHGPLFKELGADGLYAIRRSCWNKHKRYMELQEKMETDTAEFREIEAFVKHMPLRNYCMNKGWKAAIEHFAYCVANGGKLKTATAYDGMQAARITEAAIKSRDTGKIVKM